MKWCERCLSDHEGLCLDEHMRLDLSEALEAYFRYADTGGIVRQEASPGRGVPNLTLREKRFSFS
ncbi:MAG: hypothetical protein ACE5HT_08205 [Gemmatimonadales bacterium]